MHSPGLQALSSHHGRKMLNSGVVQHFSSGGLLWVPSRETEVMVQAMTREGQEASSLRWENPGSYHRMHRR